MFKKKISVERILDVVIREVEPDIRYKGSVKGGGLPGPFNFELYFTVPQSQIEKMLFLAENSGLSVTQQREALAGLKGTVNLVLSPPEGAPIKPSTLSLLKEYLIDPIHQATVFECEKHEVEVKIPWVIEDEELEQFQDDPLDLARFIKKLNSRVKIKQRSDVLSRR